MVKKHKPNYRARRFVALLVVAIASLGGAAIELDARNWELFPATQPIAQSEHIPAGETSAKEALATLEVKGRAPKTDYKRTQFGSGWARGANGCDTRNAILQRDLEQVVIDEQCKVQSGMLHDPYTGKEKQFVRGPSTSADVQIDHVVALSNAWQTGAQLLSPEVRTELANDPRNLLAVDGSANQQKGDGDTATWLPANKNFRCAYVARQIAVKQHYTLWVTPAEKTAMERVLAQCPAQVLPTE